MHYKAIQGKGIVKVITAIEKATCVDYLRGIVEVIGHVLESFGKMGPNFTFWGEDEEAVQPWRLLWT